MLDLTILMGPFQFEVFYDYRRIMSGRDRETNLLPTAPASSPTMYKMGTKCSRWQQWQEHELSNISCHVSNSWVTL